MARKALGLDIAASTVRISGGFRGSGSASNQGNNLGMPRVDVF